MILETYDNFYVVKNAISDTQIDILTNWFENRQYLTKKNGIVEIRTNDNKWNPDSLYKQKINLPYRKTTIIGMPHNTFDFIKNLLKDVFHTISNDTFEFESPIYFQKYDIGGHHNAHRDLEIGYPNRKYIVGFQLSDSDSYVGGNLYIENSKGEYIKCDRDKGSAIIYKPSLMHYVSTITKGSRYVFNECVS